MIDHSLRKLHYYYDRCYNNGSAVLNEWGYSNRLVEQVINVGQYLQKIQ